ncbi:hypothetical protein [Novipirellula artificiosorum]|uniref:Uncharacterized protein n=1 Tax=Novipirellula artificiosorum TaxID=2528016 RepID=A0A5C6DZV4_9BACT|nr:hypothetical protein [Novipirellula artificiosorum]TWU42140.1 hypothetical protein Poly41_04360 [Novipirellula artificiosorum]
MNRDNYRSIGAILGITIGILAMFSLRLDGLLAGFVFGAGGAVLGGMLGERIFAWRKTRGPDGH